MRGTSVVARALSASPKPRCLKQNINEVHTCARLQPARATREAQLEATITRDASIAQPPLLYVDACLRSWIQSHGGAVWSTLRVTDNAPCGCRGVITTEALPVDFARASPLILVPERLYMTAGDARQVLQALEAKRFGLSFWRQELPGAVQLAVLLALERRRGDDSFWAPYIRSLPEGVPCAWALPNEDLRTVLAAHGPGAEGWERAVTAARVVMHERAERAVQQYGKHLSGEITVEDVVWALGQVTSRSFGREPDVALAPYIDLCNHRHGAARPDGLMDERDGEPYAFVKSSSFGEPRALAAGEELYVSYASYEHSDPLATFLNLGFVPPELLPKIQKHAGAVPGRV